MPIFSIRRIAGLASSPVVGILTLILAGPAAADPCGMVPPLWQGQGHALTRVGDQHTFVAFRNGIETMVLRPAFHGKIDQFGMLIPFPSPPAIRKAADDIFTHLQWAMEPEPVLLDLRPRRKYRHRGGPAMSGTMPKPRNKKKSMLQPEEVRVISEEAVGMYSVAVLEAGSPAALKKWMDKHGFRYPSGMDDVVADYVRQQFAFVAIKTKVSGKSATEPRPGMRKILSRNGQGFQGAVQAMAFRFRTTKPIIPMRLSTFNPTQQETPARNIVYFLGSRPMRIDQVDTALVRRQIKGAHLLRNITTPRPVRLIGGTIDDIPPSRWQGIAAQREIEPLVKWARELFASDLQAFKRGELSLTFEDKEKELLRVSEALNLRGVEIDLQHSQSLARQKDKTLRGVLSDLRQMTMTVIDGDFPVDILRRQDLSLSLYRMPAQANTIVHYDPRIKRPRPEAAEWLIVRGKSVPRKPFWKRW